MCRPRAYNKLPINDRALFTRLAVILYYNRAEIFRRVLSRWTRCPELPTYEREKEREREGEGAFVITFPESERAPITASSAKIPIWRGRPSWITRQAAPSRLTSRNNKRESGDGVRWCTRGLPSSPLVPLFLGLEGKKRSEATIHRRERFFSATARRQLRFLVRGTCVVIGYSSTRTVATRRPGTQSNCWQSSRRDKGAPLLRIRGREIQGPWWKDENRQAITVPRIDRVDLPLVSLSLGGRRGSVLLSLLSISIYLRLLLPPFLYLLGASSSKTAAKLWCCDADAKLNNLAVSYRATPRTWTLQLDLKLVVC